MYRNILPRDHSALLRQDTAASRIREPTLKIIHSVLDHVVETFPLVTKKVLEYKSKVESGPYNGLIPRTGKEAFTKVVEEFMWHERRLMITPLFAEEMWDLSPSPYKARFNCQKEEQETCLAYVSHVQDSGEDRLQGNYAEC